MRIFIGKYLLFKLQPILEKTMKLSFNRIALVAGATILLHTATLAHDFSADIAQFNKTAATKKMDSKEAIAARVALERSQGVMEQADVKMLLRIRSLTNSALRELGEQPGFLTSEMKRVEAGRSGACSAQNNRPGQTGQGTRAVPDLVG
jgi:hypothetical protein